jgi:hypothetical protein
LKTIFQTVISRRQIRARPNENYYRKTLLFGVKGTKIKGEVKDCFPFASVIGSWLPALTFPAGHSGQPAPFLNSKQDGQKL